MLTSSFSFKYSLLALLVCTTLAVAVSISINNSNVADDSEKKSEVSTKVVNIPGGAQIWWIKDNKGDKLFPCNLFGSENESLCKNLELSEGIPASVSTFLLKVDGEYLLFDTGLGELGGQMLRNLKSINVSADSIKLIYLTHLHMDHISGLITKNSNGAEEKTFKNAVLYINKIEYDFWEKSLTNNELQKKIFKMYKDGIHLFEFGDKLPHNVQAIDAAGHTPGHTAFQYKQILVVGDLMHGYALQKDHLDINSNYDMDKQKSVESRKRLVTYAKKNNLTLAGMHLPHFGFVK